MICRNVLQLFLIEILALSKAISKIEDAVKQATADYLDQLRHESAALWGREATGAEIYLAGVAHEAGFRAGYIAGLQLGYDEGWNYYQEEVS